MKKRYKIHLYRWKQMKTEKMKIDTKYENKQAFLCTSQNLDLVRKCNPIQSGDGHRTRVGRALTIRRLRCPLPPRAQRLSRRVALYSLRSRFAHRTTLRGGGVISPRQIDRQGVWKISAKIGKISSISHEILQISAIFLDFWKLFNSSRNSEKNP